MPLFVIIDIDVFEHTWNSLELNMIYKRQLKHSKRKWFIRIFVKIFLLPVMSKFSAAIFGQAF